MCVYSGDVTTDKWFQQAWAKTGKKLDMGKSCIRFKKPEDLALDVIGEAIRRLPVKLYIEQYESVIKTMRKRSSKDGAKAAKAGRKVAAKGKKPAHKKPARAAARRAK